MICAEVAVAVAAGSGLECGMSNTLTLPAPQVRTEKDRKQPRLWNVVLLDDQHHTYDYVIEMVQRLFNHSLEHAVKLAKCVDKDGRAICMTTHREHAELKVEQIHHFGADPRLSECRGAMNAILEPAEMGGGDDEDQR